MKFANFLGLLCLIFSFISISSIVRAQGLEKNIERAKYRDIEKGYKIDNTTLEYSIHYNEDNRVIGKYSWTNTSSDVICFPETVFNENYSKYNFIIYTVDGININTKNIFKNNYNNNSNGVFTMVLPGATVRASMDITDEYEFLLGEQKYESYKSIPVIKCKNVKKVLKYKKRNRNLISIIYSDVVKFSYNKISFENP